jgi:hypothetical protein
MKSIENFDWSAIHASLNQTGFARLPRVLSTIECAEFRKQYNHGVLYRSTINMQRYRFGLGEYKYFAYPLPTSIQQLREQLYTPLATLANEWMQKLGEEVQYPSAHADLISDCHAKNQPRPTPLILRYEAGGYNTLHQDLYGEVYFPFQVVFLLSQPQQDFNRGEFVMTEQLPRAQSKAQVISLEQGDGLIFTTNFRPVLGTRGYYRVKMKHGVSPLHSGIRYALGIIFHDAT